MVNVHIVLELEIAAMGDLKLLKEDEIELSFNK